MIYSIILYRFLSAYCAAAGRAKGSGVPSAAPIDLAPRAAAVRDALTDDGGAASAFRSAPAAYEAPTSVAAATGRRCASGAYRHSILAGAVVWALLCQQHQNALLMRNANQLLC